MWQEIIREMSGRWTVAVFGLIIGGVVTWLVGRWHRHRQRKSLLQGDARDTVVIDQHLVETAVRPDGTKVPAVLRVRSLGQSEVNRVVPNGYLASELLRRAFEVTPRHTLISMEGPGGSYLLETLTNFVCDRVANAPFEHDLYVMAPCCEPAALAAHQPIIVILIAVADLALFETWPAAREVRVEHGADGARVLTLMELARQFRSEQERMSALRRAGQRTTHVETSYILDLPLDKRTCPVPVRKVPWGRFEDVLKRTNLE